jgi:hypothetical protein
LKLRSHPNLDFQGSQEIIKVSIWIKIPTARGRFGEELWDDEKIQGTVLPNFTCKLSEKIGETGIEKIQLIMRPETTDVHIMIRKGDEKA